MNNLSLFENTTDIASFQYTHNRIIIRYVDNMPIRAMFYNSYRNQTLVVCVSEDGKIKFDQKFKIEFDIPVITPTYQSFINTIMSTPRDKIDNVMRKMTRESQPTTLYVFDQDCVQYFILMYEADSHKQRTMRVFEHMLLHDCGGVSRGQHPEYIGHFRHTVDKPRFNYLNHAYIGLIMTSSPMKKKP